MSLELRPRFKFALNSSPEKVRDVFCDAITSKSEINGTAAKHHIVIKIDKSERHKWSPQMEISLEASENTTIVRGLVGPSPNTWFKFIFAYAILVLSGIVAIVIGLSQMSLDKTPMAFWFSLLALLLVVFLYLIGHFGKKIGEEQTLILFNLVNELYPKEERISVE